MAGSDVTVEVLEDDVYVVTVAREPLNPLSMSTDRELRELFSPEGLLDRQARAVVLRGAGGRAFSVGADLREFAGLQGQAEAVARLRLQISCFNTIAGCACPTIAAIEGYALGGGLELALSCDLRIMAKSAKFGLPEVRLGVFPASGGFMRLRRVAGEGVARDMAFTGRMLSAEEAWNCGLATEVVDDNCTTKTAVERAREIASHPPTGVRALKKWLTESVQPWDSECSQQAAAECGVLFETEAVQEGVAAFLNKNSNSQP